MQLSIHGRQEVLGIAGWETANIRMREYTKCPNVQGSRSLDYIYSWRFFAKMNWQIFAFASNSWITFLLSTRLKRNLELITVLYYIHLVKFASCSGKIKCKPNVDYKNVVGTTKFPQHLSPLWRRPPPPPTMWMKSFPDKISVRCFSTNCQNRTDDVMEGFILNGPLVYGISTFQECCHCPTNHQAVCVCVCVSVCVWVCVCVCVCVSVCAWLIYFRTHSRQRILQSRELLPKVRQSCCFAVRTTHARRDGLVKSFPPRGISI